MFTMFDSVISLLRIYSGKEHTGKKFKMEKNLHVYYGSLHSKRIHKQKHK